MRIENLRSEGEGSQKRVLATVHWEDADRRPNDIYFQTESAFAEDLICNPDAFLLAGIMPAFHLGERRLKIEGEVCPRLREGLYAAMGVLRGWWFEPSKPLVTIESKIRRRLLNPTKTPRAGLFFSGGIDSFAALRINQLAYPAEHPSSFKDAYIVHGFHPEESDDFANLLLSYSDILEPFGLTVIPVSTNIVEFCNGYTFWAQGMFGASFAAVGNAFVDRLTSVAVGSPGRGEVLFPPDGSHPLLDPNYSSIDLEFRHDNVVVPRLEKTRLLAEWDPEMTRLRVCNATNLIGLEFLNCGKCEKCLRTMLGLLALGLLENTKAFGDTEVTPRLVRYGVTMTRGTLPYYLELLEPLRARGRTDLVKAISKKISEFRKPSIGGRLRTRIRRFDHQHLNGKLMKVKQWMAQKV